MRSLKKLKEERILALPIDCKCLRDNLVNGPEGGTEQLEKNERGFYCVTCVVSARAFYFFACACVSGCKRNQKKRRKLSATEERK